jgi:tRNA 5-methylaminomethyl-2-thiouridine biosynthesis bifunctional protein
MPEVLRPAELAFSDDGTPWSEAYGDVYHAAAGGPGQAEHVFLRGNGLPDRWRGATRFVILETGFGTGLNFLATWAAWRAAPTRPERLHYLAIEKHPFQAHDLERLHARWPDYAELSSALRARWPILVPGAQRLELDGGRVILTLLLGDAETMLPRLAARIDAFFLDGFAPARNPEMWSPELCRQLANLAAPGATLATWSVAGGVREALAAAGFALEKSPGYSSKREMLTGRYSPPAYRPARAAPTPPEERHAIVLGAGLAGSACCERLAARGWRVDLIERHEAPASEASGNLAGIFHPLIARDDSIQARLTRSAFLYALDAWCRLRARGYDFPWDASGLGQLARDAEHEALQRELPALMGYPAEYVEYLDASAMAAHIGHAVPMGGWRVARGGWANPAGLCRANLSACGDALRVHYAREVTRLERIDDVWRAIAANGQAIAEAPHVVIANGMGAARLPWTAPLPLRSVRGQVTLIPRGMIPEVGMPMCREGYLTPSLEGMHCAGASYDLDENPAPRPECDAGNMQRLARILDDVPALPDPLRLGSRVGFRAVSPDRLPLVGALPDYAAMHGLEATQLVHLPRVPGMHVLLGYASRGIIWSALMAELLASCIEGEPLPVEADLAEAVDPGRYPLKALRKGKGPAWAGP